MMRFVWLVVIASAATVGLRAAEPSSEVIYFDHDKAAAVFAKGGILLDKGVYQIRPGRRTEPGAVETHLEYTDILYVTEGSATLVTGGTVVGERKTNDPSEPRGKSLTGGQSYHLTKGDILVIPHGVPHWFQQVDGTFTNYTVKVRTGK